MQVWSDKRLAYTEDLMSKATATLAGSLADRQPQAKWDGFSTLLQRINQVRNSRPPQSDPAWVPLLTSEFVREYATVEASRKQYLLDMFASTVDSPELVPLLESVLDNWKPGDYYEAAHSALRALHRVDPARARARVIAELVKEKTWLDVASLEMVPASAVPPHGRRAHPIAGAGPAPWRMESAIEYGRDRTLRDAEGTAANPCDLRIAAGPLPAGAGGVLRPCG